MHSTRNDHARTRAPRVGFTLVELMVVVTILGILSAIAVPFYSSYLYKSKTSEAVGFLAEIKSRQESYRADFGAYCNASADDPTNTNPALPPTDSQRSWVADPNWDQLGAKPPGNSVYFAYSTVSGIPGTDPSSVGFPSNLGYDGSDFWFVSRAIGDLDGDSTTVTFESYSHSQNIWISNTDGWE